MRVIKQAAIALALVGVLPACGEFNRYDPPPLVSSEQSNIPSRAYISPLESAQLTTVMRVIDGDTIETELGTIRLIGVNTPEIKKTGSECFGLEATEFLAGVIGAGTKIRVVYDQDQYDPYGRILAYVYRQWDGLFVNAEIVAAGYGEVMTVSPNTYFEAKFNALEQQARARNLGLWKYC